MTAEVRQLLDEALRLSESERAELAAKSIESLEGEDDSEAVEVAWAREIECRCATLDSGETARSSDWGEVRRRIEHEILRG